MSKEMGTSRGSLHEASGMLPPLRGLTVADVGAGFGNNLNVWRDELGPEGRLVETDVDVNCTSYMAYAARLQRYADNTLVIHALFDDPCLPVGQFDLVLCSQLHSHISVGPYPRNPTNERAFRKKSKGFLTAIRRSMRGDGSTLVVIEGLQNYKSNDPQRFYLKKQEAIANIEASGFKLIESRQSAIVWVATFRPLPGQ